MIDTVDTFFEHFSWPSPNQLVAFKLWKNIYKIKIFMNNLTVIHETNQKINVHTKEQIMLF